MTSETGNPRDKLLAAARHVLAERGIEGLTLRSIAREAGVSHGAPLRHFPSLAALLAALSAQGFHDLMAAVDRFVESAEGRTDEEGTERTDDAMTQLARAGAGYISFAISDPGVFGVMFRSELCDTSDPDYQRAGAASFNQLVQLVRAAQAQGWRPGVPTDQLAAVLWAKVHGLAQLWQHGALQAVVGPEGLDQLVDLATQPDV